MNEIPSVKTHPILMTLITMTFLLCFGAACIVVGWTARVMSESRAELAVVVDDGEFMQQLEVKAQQWILEFNDFMEGFYEKYGSEIPECMAKPMPDFYHDNDYGLQSDREHEE